MDMYIYIYIWGCFVGTRFLHRGSKINPQVLFGFVRPSAHKNIPKSTRTATQRMQKINTPPRPHACRGQTSRAVDSLTLIFVPEGQWVVQLSWSEVLHKPMNKKQIEELTTPICANSAQTFKTTQTYHVNPYVNYRKLGLPGSGWGGSAGAVLFI
jgi:hypothetical protein